MIEIWRDVKGFEDAYSVSNLGRVKSKERKVPNRWGGFATLHERILKPSKSSTERYWRVTLCANGKTRRTGVHVLVAENFIPNPENKPFVDHINTDRDDNSVSNLRWCTSAENNNNPITLKHKSDLSKWSKPCRNMATGEVFRSVKELAESLNRCLSGVARACRHHGMTAGVHVEYV